MANLSNINNILRISSSGVGLNKDNTGPSELDIESAGADIIDMTRTGQKTYRFAISGASAFSLFDVAANADRLIINSAGNATFAGSVTVGGADDATALFLKRSGGANVMAINTNANGSWTMFDYAAGTYTSGITQKSGNVGIGTGTPTANYPLTLRSKVGDYTKILDWGTDVGGSWGTMQISMSAPYATELRSGAWNFAQGNVGIGTDSPGTKLQVNQTNNDIYQLTLHNTHLNTTTKTRIGNWANDSKFSSNYMQSGGTKTQDDATISSWVQSMGGSLDIFDISRSPAGSTTLSSLIRMDSSGNVGIGTTNADSKLKVEARNASNVIYAGFRVGYNATSNNYYDADTHHFRLGTGSSAGGDLYVGGGVYLGGTAAANKLDDYEEGTFYTNVLGTNVTNYSASGNNGRYTKIGRQVIVTFQYSVSAGTGQRYMVVSNLPFVQHTASHDEQGYCSNYPVGQRRSGIVVNNSSGESNSWYVSWYNNSAQSNNGLRATIIYTTT